MQSAAYSRYLPVCVVEVVTVGLIVAMHLAMHWNVPLLLLQSMVRSEWFARVLEALERLR